MPMKCRISCDRRRFWADEVVSTRVTVPPVGERILLVSCTLAGRCLTPRESRLLVETAPVALAVDVDEVAGVTFSVLLPAGVPPSYRGASVSVVYALTVSVQTKRATVSQSLRLQLVSREAGTVLGPPSKLAVSGKYLAVVEDGDPVVDVCRGVVELLRASGSEQPAWLPESEKSALSQTLDRVGQLELPSKARHLGVRQQEAQQAPLGRYQTLRGRLAASRPTKAAYTIRNGGTETASVVVALVEEAAPWWLASLSVRLLQAASQLKLSLYQLETVDDRERQTVFYQETKQVTGCRSFFTDIPIDRSANPAITTALFTTGVYLQIEIDSAIAQIPIG